MIEPISWCVIPAPRIVISALSNSAVHFLPIFILLDFTPSTYWDFIG